MHPTLAPFEALVQEGYLNKNEMDDLVLYNYNDFCTFEKYWGEYTTQARGIIFNKVTGECVARPFLKFHNLGETEKTQFKNLPNEPYEVFEKYDGSMGVLYVHQVGASDPDNFVFPLRSLAISTRGSFSSVQAQTATTMLHAKYEKLCNALQASDFLGSEGDVFDYTLLFEIIYPENRLCAGGRLVVDYGEMRDLILLGAIHKKTGQEMSYERLCEVAKEYGFPVARRYEHTIEEMIAMQKTLPVEKEGFVVHFLKSNLRVKIKGDEYCKRQKILNSMTPLNMWALLEKGVIPDTYKIEIPEEILPEALAIEADLSQKYQTVKKEIEEDAKKIPFTLDGTKETRKNIALWLKANKLKHHNVMFSYILNREKDVEDWVKELIRPHNNVL